MNQTNEEGTNELTQTSEREKGGRGGVLTLSYAIIGSLYVWGRDEGDPGLRPRERRGGGDGKEGGQTCVCVHLRTEELDDESVFIVCALVLRAGPGVCPVWFWVVYV